MSPYIRHQFVVLLIWLLILQMSKVMGFKPYDSRYDVVAEDEEVADQLIEEFQREELKRINNEQWNWRTSRKVTAITTVPNWSTSYCANCQTRNNLFYHSYKDEFLLTTSTGDYIDFTYRNQFLEDSNLTFWESFAKDFDSCLHLRTKFNEFHLRPLSNGYFKLSNVTVPIKDKSAVAGLLKTYYDVALWRISQLSSSQNQDHCFYMLNRFFCTIQLENLYHLKLQSVACHRMYLPFDQHFAPQYQKDSLLLNDEKLDVSCNPPGSEIYIQLEGNTYVHSNIPVDLELKKINYFEQGCFEFFVQRIQQKATFYKENDLVALPPVLSAVNLTLSFPDGTFMFSNASSLMNVLRKYYNCQLLEILSMKNRESRLCFMELFHRNMDLFMIDAIRQLQPLTVNINDLISLQSTIQWHENVAKTFAVRYDHSSKTEKMWSITLFTTDVTNSEAVAEKQVHVERTERITGTTIAEFHENKINLQAVRTHIIHGALIIVGVAFCLLVFMCFFILWLSYMSHVARLKQQQETISLLQSLRSEI